VEQNSPQPAAETSASTATTPTPSTTAHAFSRRAMLRWTGIGGLSAAAVTALPGTARAANTAPSSVTPTTMSAPKTGTAEPAPVTLAATPIRPPAAPLAVRQPYLSTWLPATILPGTWQTFWNGSTTAMAGIARIDGTSYLFMGAPSVPLPVPNGNHGTQQTTADFEQALDQTLLEVTPTRSRFHLRGGGVALVVEFFSPVEPGDIRRQSMPLSYLTITASSDDGAAHDVQVYVDISGEWTSGDNTQQITWAPESPSSGGTGLRSWTVQLANQQPLVEQNQLAAWGTILWSTPQRSGLTYQSGQDVVVRGQFLANGTLSDTNDTNYRAINDNWPVFAFAVDLGQVKQRAGSVELSIGHVRTPAVSYLGTGLASLWTTYWASWQDMAVFFHTDAASARHRADTLDASISEAARTAGGTHYEGLCALALRQAYGGTELVVGPDGSPWAFLKEISSDGNVSTIDVLFPASPVWIHVDPEYLSLLLTPLLDYAEKGGWPKTFAEHDLGSSYPVAAGHNDGNEEDMPVEESGNMLIMVAAYLQGTSASSGSAFATTHYQILKQWADYLVANLPDPGFQNQTDDFAGSIAHSVNLALKGIVAVAAMARIATAAGNSADATHYQGLAQQFIDYWTSNAQDPSAAHLDLTYNGSGGGDGTWGTTYNGFADRLLGTNLVPDSVRAEQAAWYERVGNAFGLPLQVPHSYAKSDWELFTAAWLADYPIKQQLIDRVYAYANTTPSRVAFSDLYSTITGNQVAFQARPVQGGIFALLALTAARAS
jgi:hypothetical protein